MGLNPVNIMTGLASTVGGPGRSESLSLKRLATLLPILPGTISGERRGVLDWLSSLKHEWQDSLSTKLGFVAE